MSKYINRQITGNIILTNKYDTDTLVFDSAAGGLTSNQKYAIDYLVRNLKMNGLWNKMKAIYPLIGGTAEKAAPNLKIPGQYNIIWSDGAFDAQGWQNGNGYGDTQLIPSTCGLSSNSTHISAFITGGASTPPSSQATDFGVYDNANYWRFFCRNNTNGVYLAAYVPGTAITTGTNTTTNGYYITQRTAADYFEIVKNNVVLNSATSAPGNLPTTYSLYLGARNYIGSADNKTDRKYTIFTIGDGLTINEKTILYNLITNFNTLKQL